MLRVSDIVGKTIVSASTGEKVGEVADVLIDDTATRLVGIVIAGGVLGSEHVLPYEDVQIVGRDAVVARSADGVMTPSEWRNRQIGASRSRALRNRRVITVSGRQLGTVKDVRVDGQTGAIEGYELADGSFTRSSKRRVLPQSPSVTIGPDAVVVADQDGHAEANGSATAGTDPDDAGRTAE